MIEPSIIVEVVVGEENVQQVLQSFEALDRLGFERPQELVELLWKIIFRRVVVEIVDGQCVEDLVEVVPLAPVFVVAPESLSRDDIVRFLEVDLSVFQGDRHHCWESQGDPLTPCQHLTHVHADTACEHRDQEVVLRLV